MRLANASRSAVECDRDEGEQHRRVVKGQRRVEPLERLADEELRRVLLVRKRRLKEVQRADDAHARGGRDRCGNNVVDGRRSTVDVLVPRPTPCTCAGMGAGAGAGTRPVYHLQVPAGASLTIIVRDGCVHVDGDVRDITASGGATVTGNVSRLVTNGSGAVRVNGNVAVQENHGAVSMRFGRAT